MGNFFRSKPEGENNGGQVRTEECATSSNSEANTAQPNTHTLQEDTIVGVESIAIGLDTDGCGHSKGIPLEQIESITTPISPNDTQRLCKQLSFCLFCVVLDIKDHEVDCIWEFQRDKLYLTIPAKVLLHRNLKTCKVGNDADTDKIPTTSNQSEWYFFDDFLGSILQNGINERTTLVAKDGRLLSGKLVLGVLFEQVVLHVVSKFTKSANRLVPGNLRWILPLPDHWSLQSGQCLMDIMYQLPGDWTRSCCLKTVSMAEATIAYFQRDILVNSEHVMVVNLQASYTEVTQWTLTSSVSRRVLVCTTNAGVQSALLLGFKQLLIQAFGAPVVYRYSTENLSEYLELCRLFIYKLGKKNDLAINLAIPHSLRKMFSDITGEQVDQSMHRNRPACRLLHSRKKGTVLTISPELVQAIISAQLGNVKKFLMSFQRNDGFCPFRSIIVFGELANYEIIRQFIHTSLPGLPIYNDTDAMVTGARSIGSDAMTAMTV